jgi:WD40 repeat protein
VSGSDEAILYDISSRKRIQNFTSPNLKFPLIYFYSVCFSAYGHFVYGGHGNGLLNELYSDAHSASYLFTGIDVWRVKGGNYVHVLETKHQRVPYLAVSPAGSMLVAACEDNYIRVIIFTLLSLITHKVWK